MHFCDFFCIFAFCKASAFCLESNARSPKFYVFWRPLQDIRTFAARYCPARRNNLPRAGQISNMPSRSLLHAVSFPVTTGLLPLFLPGCNEDYIALDTKTSCFGIVEGLSFIVKCRFFPAKTTCFGVAYAVESLCRKGVCEDKMEVTLFQQPSLL